MRLFGQVVRTVVNTVTLPVAVARDAVDWPIERKSSTVQAIERLKREAAEQKRTQP
jgi:hypothetical protein